MRFEEILPLLREKRRARHTTYDSENEYWIIGKQGNEAIGMPMMDTLMRLNNKGEFIMDSRAWGIPRWLITSDKWVLIEVKDE